MKSKKSFLIHPVHPLIPANRGSDRRSANPVNLQKTVRKAAGGFKDFRENGRVGFSGKNAEVFRANDLPSMRALLLFALSILAFQNCTHRLGAGIFGNDLPYLAKPLLLGDSAASATYATLGLNGGYGYASQADANGSGFAALHRAHTWQYGSVAYGGFAYAGQYRIGPTSFNQPVYDPQTRQTISVNPFSGPATYFGGGLRVAVDLNLPIDSHVDLRILGIEFSHSTEAGYLTYLRQWIPEGSEPAGLLGRKRWLVVRDRDLTTFGLTSELVIKDPYAGRATSLKGVLGRSAGDYGRLFNGASVFVYNATLAHHNERRGWVLYGQVSQLFSKTTAQVGFSRQLGRVRRRAAF